MSTWLEFWEKGFKGMFWDVMVDSEDLGIMGFLYVKVSEFVVR